MSRLEIAQLKQRQLQRELQAVERARQFASNKLENNVEKGNVNSLPYKTPVMKHMLNVVDDVINNIMLKRNSPTLTPAKELIVEVSKELDLSVLICDFLLSSLVKEPLTITVLGRQLGNRILRAYQMAIFIKENKFYYEEMTRFLNDSRLGSFDEVYKRFLAGANIDREIMKFDSSIVASFGTSLLHMICEHNESFLTKITVSVSPNRKNTLLTFTCDMFELMVDIIDSAILNTFDRIPMVCPPREWKKQGNAYIGGFLSEYLTKATPIQVGDANRRIPDIPQVYMDALNKLQNTRWRVNPFMYKVIKTIFNDNKELGKIPRATKVDLVDIPKGIDNEEVVKELRSQRRQQHIENVKTFSKGIGLLTALQQCEELLNDVFYFVHTMDYRGRLYCMSGGLNTQGADYIKALIHFDEAKVVGEEGLYWLKVRAANTMGYDKVSLDERVDFIDDLIRRGYMEAIAKNPLENSHLWTTPVMAEGSIKKIDKPLQFLATCYELAVAYRLKDPTKHMSRLPVGLDGACNGSQHLSVLSNNETLAIAVNVLPDDKQHDVYQEVVDHMYNHMVSYETFNELKNKGHDIDNIKFTINWLLSKFDKAPRDLTKRCVMTLAYGSTYRGRMDFVREFLKDFAKEDKEVERLKNKMVSIITYMIDKSLNALAGDALKAMKFLQDVAAHNVDKTGTWIYTTALGLEVDNFIPKITRRKIRFMNYQLMVQERTNYPDKSKIKACSAPNYIHSMDACHLIKVILSSGFDSFMAIHDDIGVHPSDTGKLFRVIREQFVELYKDKDYFKELSNTIVLDKPEPFDITKVIKSEYFFA